jgi:hypothetical protein
MVSGLEWTTMPAQWPGFGMDAQGMRQAITLADDMQQRVLALLTESSDEANPLWPQGPPAEEYASTQYCDWRDGGIQSSAATYRRHLLGQHEYLAELIGKLEGALKDTEALDERGEQTFGKPAEGATP